MFSNDSMYAGKDSTDGKVLWLIVFVFSTLSIEWYFFKINSLNAFRCEKWVENGSFQMYVCILKYDRTYSPRHHIHTCHSLDMHVDALQIHEYSKAESMLIVNTINDCETNLFLAYYAVWTLFIVWYEFFFFFSLLKAVRLPYRCDLNKKTIKVKSSRMLKYLSKYSSLTSKTLNPEIV